MSALRAPGFARSRQLLAAAMSALCALGLLGGCATPTSVTPLVMAHSRWDAVHQPGRFAFERLPSQDARAEAQQQLESAALPTLLRLGFTPTDTEPDYLVQLQAQVRVERDPWLRQDPFWHPYWGWYWGPPGMAPVPWGPAWGPAWRSGGAWMPAPPPPPVARMQASVLIRERRSGAVLYEAHARHERPGAADARLWPALFDAALRRFPAALTEPVDIEVPLAPPVPAR